MQIAHGRKFESSEKYEEGKRDSEWQHWYFFFLHTEYNFYFAFEKLAVPSKAFFVYRYNFGKLSNDLTSACAKLLQSCLIRCDPLDCSLPGSSVHRILQARILEWVAMPSSRGSSQPRDWIRVSCIADRFFTTEPLGKPLMISYLARIFPFYFFLVFFFSFRFISICISSRALIYLFLGWLGQTDSQKWAQNLASLQCPSRSRFAFPAGWDGWGMSQHSWFS